MKKFPKLLSRPSQLDITQIRFLFQLAEQYKSSCRTPTWQSYNNLQKPCVSTLFFENSTRTKLSFALAALKLGCHYLDFDTEKSSLKKGEDFLETLHTLKAQGFDCLIIRTPELGLFEKLQNKSPITLINAGEGIGHHPSQALLDVWTFIEDGHNLENTNMVIAGDILHSRVANSLCEILPQFGVKINLVGPSECLPKTPPMGVSIQTNMDEALKDATLLYLLRIQKERHDNKVSYFDSYHDDFGFNDKRLKQYPHLKVYHPGPANIGVEISQKAIESPNYRGHFQVLNSTFIRMAILEAMLTANMQGAKYDGQKGVEL